VGLVEVNARAGVHSATMKNWSVALAIVLSALLEKLPQEGWGEWGLGQVTLARRSFRERYHKLFGAVGAPGPATP